MADVQGDKTTQLTVRVVTGCLTCAHYDPKYHEPAATLHTGECTHPAKDDETYLLWRRVGRRKSKPPDWCPLRLKEGERLEVVLP